MFYCTTRIDKNNLYFDIVFNIGSLETIYSTKLDDKFSSTDIFRKTYLYEKFEEDVFKYSSLFFNKRLIFIPEIVDIIFEHYFKDKCNTRCLNYLLEDIKITNKFNKKIEKTKERFNREWKKS